MAGWIWPGVGSGEGAFSAVVVYSVERCRIPMFITSNLIFTILMGIMMHLLTRESVL